MKLLTTSTYNPASQLKPDILRSRSCGTVIRKNGPACTPCSFSMSVNRSPPSDVGLNKTQAGYVAVDVICTGTAATRFPSMPGTPQNGSMYRNPLSPLSSLHTYAPLQPEINNAAMTCDLTEGTPVTVCQSYLVLVCNERVNCRWRICIQLAARTQIAHLYSDLPA